MTMDIKLAHECIIAAAHAYFDKECNFNVEGVHGSLKRRGKYNVLAFRGTELDRLKDIAADLKAKPNKHGCHSGFEERWQAAKPAIVDLVRAREQRPLLITGHSLGAALAVVAAHDLQDYWPIEAVYTFGQPRVGLDVWNRQMQVPVYRFVNMLDPVTGVPGGKYQHMGEPYYLGPFVDGKPELVNRVSLWWRIRHWWRVSLKHAWVEDHLAGIYSRKVQSLRWHWEVENGK